MLFFRPATVASGWAKWPSGFALASHEVFAQLHSTYSGSVPEEDLWGCILRGCEEGASPLCALRAELNVATKSTCPTPRRRESSFKMLVVSKLKR
jgi:hypothetical protein